MATERTLKEFMAEHRFIKAVFAHESWRTLITVDIPAMMCIDGLVADCVDVLPVYVAIDYWNAKYSDGYSQSWKDIMELEGRFMDAWRRFHHPALGVKVMNFGNRNIPCIYVKQVRRREED